MKKQSFLSPNYLPLLRNNLIYGSLAILTLFVFIVAGTMLINGCNKDGEITDPELSYRNSSNTSTSAILSKINFDQDGNILLGSGTSQVTLQHASIEYQREVSDYIFDNLSFSRIDSMREMYGHPVWELATIDTNTGNSINYLVSVPMVKENVITSYLLFQ
ncbi:MAG: hypothetical protein IPH57_13485 [Saprospiraceae bacterium]|nr:hypothetical protein [Saprospiraceae bacterium]